MAHNEWDAAAGRSEAKVLYNFGREDQLDLDALIRLVASINRYLGVDEPSSSAATGPAGSVDAAGLGFVAARRLGEVWALDGLWEQLGIAATLRTLARSAGSRCRWSGCCSHW